MQIGKRKRKGKISSELNLFFPRLGCICDGFSRGMAFYHELMKPTVKTARCNAAQQLEFIFKAQLTFPLLLSC